MHLEFCYIGSGELSSGTLGVAAAKAGCLTFADIDGRLEGYVRDLAARFAKAGVELGIATSEPSTAVAAVEAGVRASRVLLSEPFAARPEDVAALRGAGLAVWAEAVTPAEAKRAAELGADRIVVKGNEAGGRVGEDTTLVLLQKVRREVKTPLIARGGVGLHTAGACLLGGAAGVALDWQLSLCEEADLPGALRRKIERMDGGETAVLGQDIGYRYRAYLRPGETAAAELAAEAGKIRLDASDRAERTVRWRDSLEQSARSGELLLLGQDACFAKPLAERFRTVSGVCRAIRREAVRHARVAAARDVLREGGPLAESHGTRFPIVQGPMTRVSDRADFADAVEAGGALPILALALMRRKQVAELLDETAEKLGDRPWGVGILGFVPQELREEQLDEILRRPPKYAVIAGGRPDQAKALEEKGIATYLHIPSPELLRMYLKSGVRRVILEGRECGGHVGPRTSFVLWEQMVDVILEHLRGEKVKAADHHILFAGGIHDDVSAAMVSAVAAPLSERGVKVGVLLGTGYLFTKEAVETGAIQPTFQNEAIACRDTVLLESGVGHATRCADSPFSQQFVAEKQRLQGEGAAPESVRETLEGLNLGRLRIASKGIVRSQGADGKALYEKVDERKQRQNGLFMIGQVAGLRSSVCTIEELHRDVAASSAVLAERARPPAGKDDRPAGGSPRRPSDIAIVGLSCVLPGADNLAQYRRNLVEGVNAIGEVPFERWDWKLYFDSDRRARDKVYSRWGGFINDIAFNPLQFGMPPNSVPSVEPMQLVTLQLVRDALADAGYLDREFDRSKTSVVVGTGGGVGELGLGYGFRSMIPHYVDRAGGDAEQAADLIDSLEGSLPEWTEDSFAGLLLNVVAGRVANRFDLGGTNFIVDAACATSLAALRLGANELETGASDTVIVAGVDTMQSPFGFLCFSKTQALSPNGQCRTFDESADGIVIAEGFGVCVMKRLEDAERDGDEIYAVLKGVGASSDGRDKGLTAPRPEGQRRALERAYEKAGFPAETVGLVEAHGTGTIVGDRTEVASLTGYFQPSEENLQTCALGSVKSMIGHTKCTAGLAGLIKVALGLKHKALLPTINVSKPNPATNFAETPFYINTETRPWLERPDGAPRRAGVSAFGFGGTNFHAVLEEYAPPEGAEDAEQPLADWPAELFVWRAEAVDPIQKSARRIASAVADGSSPELADLAATVCWQQGRGPGEHCLAVVAGSLDELRERLESFLGKVESGLRAIEDPRGLWYSAEAKPAGGTAFLFPGQGSQRVDMLRELALAFPAVRRMFERADRALGSKLGRPLSRFVFPPPSFTDDEREARQQALTATNVAQPALGVADAALLEALRTLGVEPDVVAGHSYGELVALYAAGALGFDELIAISEARGRLMIEAAEQGLGTMAAVQADEAQTRAVIDSIEGVWIANLNAPNQTVISGTEEGIDNAVTALEKGGLKARRFPVAAAFHSPLIGGAREPFAQALGEIAWRPPAIPVLSNATAESYPDEPERYPQILADHLTQPVRFADQVRNMYADGVRTFIEVGPGAVLSGLAGRTLEKNHLAVALDSASRNGLEQLLQSLARLAVAGVPVRTQPLFEGRVRTGMTVEALLDDAMPRPLPPTTWMIAGGQSVPLAKYETGEWGPKAAKKLPPAKVFESKPAAEPAREASEPAAVPGPAPSVSQGSSQASARPPSTSAPSGADESLMDGHHRLMSRFLASHQRVMLAALRGDGAAQAEVLPQGPESNAPSPTPQPTAPRPAPPPPPAEAAAEPEPPVPTSAAAPEPAPAPAAEEAQAAQPARLDREAIAERLIGLVADRTGYPKEMLELDLDLEGDLSVDSIKRVEIFGALQEEADFSGASIEGSVETLAKLKTLGEIVDWLVDRAEGAPDAPAAPLEAPAEPTAPAAKAPATESKPEPAPTGPAARPLVRQRLRMDDAPASLGELEIDGCALVIDDGAGGGERLAARLEELGVATEVFSRDVRNERSATELVNGLRGRRGRIGALIDLAPLAPLTPEDSSVGFRERLDIELYTVFHVARFLEADLREAGARILSASRMGGAYGLDLDPAADWWPGAGATGGFVKSLAREWPEACCRTVDFEIDAPFETIVDRLVDELRAEGDELEIGYRQGRRQVVGVEEAPLPESDGPPELSGDAVVLVTGGAGGINAETAIELAKAVPARFVLTGRSPLPEDDEPADLAAAKDERAIKAALIERIKQSGEKPTPPAVEAAYRTVRKKRELRGAIERLKATGARVDYRAVDASDPAAFGELIDRLYAEYGRIDGVIHGAGVIEDKLVRDKTPESFERVLRPKIDGALTLAARLRPEGLKFLFFYSSVSGRYGNRGQADYAAANETLNKLARRLDARWPARVAALNWGPWKDAGGMVSPELAVEFEKAGVQLISSDEGCQALVREVLAGGTSEPEVLFGGPLKHVKQPVAPKPQAVAAPLVGGAREALRSNGSYRVVIEKDPRRDVYLNDHQLDGTPVMPMAMVLEFVVEAAEAGWPGLSVQKVRDFAILRGVTFELAQSRVLRLQIKQTEPQPDGMDVEFELYSDGERTQLHYKGKIELRRGADIAPVESLSLKAARPLGISLQEAYDRWLFHGPLFEAVQEVESLGENGVTAKLATSTPSRFFARATEGAWSVDPAMIDAGLQLVILWARTYRDETPLPSRLGCFHRLGPPPSDGGVRCEVEIRSKPGSPNMVTDLRFSDRQGRLFARMEGMETACSRALNRLGGRTAGTAHA